MSLRSWLARYLGSDAPDPAVMVQVATVRPYEVPVLRQVLADNGIASEEAESVAPVTWDERSCVLVSSANEDAALRVLADFRSR